MKISRCWIGMVGLSIRRTADALSHHARATTTIPSRAALRSFHLRPSTCLTAVPADIVGGASAFAPVAGSDASVLKFFLQTLIANGVPAFFTILVIGFTAVMLGKARSKRATDELLKSSNPVAELYDDLYGDLDQGEEQGSMLARLFGGGGSGRGGVGLAGKITKLPKNSGVPDMEYIEMTHLNRMFDSYQYSLTAATHSKAAAAAQLRKSSFIRAFGKALAHLSPHAQQQLRNAEQEFLKEASELTAQIQSEQTRLTCNAVDEELETLGLKSVYELDPNVTTTSTETSAIDDNPGKKKKKKKLAFDKTTALKALGKAQRELQNLELDFVKDVIAAVGPQHATSVRTALLGDVVARGSGGLLQTLQTRPLSQLLGDGGASARRLFVTRFPGDTTASQVNELRQEVTAIVRSALPGDEALVVLQTGGGTVTGYGLAAGQLLRFKDAGLKLTIAVEQVAASGGYMMCCVADHIVASPFAVLGSIGVLTDVPNVYERLKTEGIEFQTVTAGKYKRTITPTKKVTKEDFDKTKQDVEEILVLFKEFVAQNRPQLDIENVATGETWFGRAALEKKLCDEIMAVDDVLVNYVDKGYNVYEVKYKPPDDQFGSFGRFLPVGARRDRGWLRRGIKLFVNAMAEEVHAGLQESDTIFSLERQYMAQDDASERNVMKS